MTRPRMSALVAGFAMVVAITGWSSPALAEVGPPPPSELLQVADVTLAAPGAYADVSTRLDPDTCHNALENGQSYSILATSSAPAAVAITPGESPVLKCEATRKNPTVLATFRVTASITLCGDGITTSRTETMSLMPVSPHEGIQNKMTGPMEFDVTVNNIPACVVDGPPPTGGTGAAAPAVANAQLNVDLADSGPLVPACKAVYGAKAWRGGVVSAVAAWMPKPESVKNHLDQDEWVAYVESEVRHLCGISLVSTDAPVPAAPDGYDTLPAYAP